MIAPLHIKVSCETYFWKNKKLFNQRKLPTVALTRCEMQTHNFQYTQRENGHHDEDMTKYFEQLNFDNSKKKKKKYRKISIKTVAQLSI